ncbi:uncharacterized protein LOC119098393 [Pollicipes pollicipes]|uniref:uncharacterized protein LOC119098393 n=1 Tax=Pollicipes pollicipes TaxID=41117 RepID=UPI001885098B|nr:uncharacterized protein LOC119098393 [Pollicipes pollicipes]
MQACPTQAAETAFRAVRRQFRECRTVEELLTVGGRRQLSRTESLLWLISLAELATTQAVPPDAFTAHPCYQEMGRQMTSGPQSSAPHQLLAPARALLRLGVSPADPILALLVNDLIWSLRKMTMRQLVQAFSLARSQLATGDSRLQQLHKLSMEMIQLRWVEITEPQDILPILKHSFHAARQHEPASVRDCVRTLFALQKLSFPDQVLLEKVGRDLVTQTPAVEEASLLGSALTAAGMLHWRHLEFLEAAAVWYEKHADSVRPHDVISLIITLATVNFCPSNADALLPVWSQYLGSV